MLKNPVAITLARKLEMFAYSQAGKLIVLSDGFADNISRKGIPRGKLAVVSQWADTESVRPDLSGKAFREEHGIASNAFVVLHAGNIGDKQGLELLVQAAKHLDGEKDIQFVIVGDGARKAAVVAEAVRLRAGNVTFLPLQPEAQFAGMLAAADVLALHQHAGVTDSVVPSKLLTYLASGKPIVATAAADSGTRRVMELAECGPIVEPENPAAFADAILRLFEDRNLGPRFGASGRDFCCKTFSRQVVLSRLESLLYETAGISRPPSQQERAVGLAAKPVLVPGDVPGPLA